jgi:hypothetical protein
MKRLFVIFCLFVSASLFADSKMVCDQMEIQKGDATCQSLTIFMPNLTEGEDMYDGVIWVENLNGKSFLKQEDGYVGYEINGNTFELSYDAGYWGELTSTDGKVFSGTLMVADEWRFFVVCSLER